MSESPISVSNLLPEKIDNLADEVRDHWKQSGGFAGRIAWDGAGDEVLKKIRGCLPTDPFDAFATAWGKLRELQDYKQHPRDDPEKYNVGSNTVTLDAHPEVFVRIGPFRTPPLRFVYTIEAVFEAVNLTILNGAITAVSYGACEISGVLKTAGGTALHEPCKLPKMESRDALTFSNPIPIP